MVWSLRLEHVPGYVGSSMHCCDPASARCQARRETWGKRVPVSVMGQKSTPKGNEARRQERVCWDSGDESLG